MLAELLVLLEAVKGLLGCALVGLLLAVALGVAGIDAAQNNGGAEHRVLVGVGVGIDKFKLDGYPVPLGPLDESRLEVLVGLDQVIQVEVFFYQAVDDELAAALIALVQIDGSDERLEGIAAKVAVMGGVVGQRAHVDVEVQGVADAVQALALHDLGSCRGEESLVLAGVGGIKERKTVAFSKKASRQTLS